MLLLAEFGLRNIALMIKIIRIILVLLLLGYIIVLFDAYILGYNMTSERVLDKSFKLGRFKGATKYWVYTDKRKINIDPDLYSALGVDDSIQIYNSKLFHTPLEVNCQIDNSIDIYNVCFTKTASGFALLILFFTINLISLVFINRGTYRAGKIGLMVLLIFFYIITLINHVYA